MGPDDLQPASTSKPVVSSWNPTHVLRMATPRLEKVMATFIPRVAARRTIACTPRGSRAGIQDQARAVGRRRWQDDKVLLTQASVSTWTRRYARTMVFVSREASEENKLAHAALSEPS